MKVSAKLSGPNVDLDLEVYPLESLACQIRGWGLLYYHAEGTYSICKRVRTQCRGSKTVVGWVPVWDWDTGKSELPDQVRQDFEEIINMGVLSIVG